MKTISKTLLGILALAVIAFLVWNNNNNVVEESINMVTSADGKASISIIDSALPNGLTLDSLSISKGTDEEGAIVYNLEPSGTVFTKAISVAVTVDSMHSDEGISIPLVSLISDGEEEMIKEVEVELSQDQSTITVSVPVTHFSKIRIKTDAMLKIALTAPGGQYVLQETVPIEGYVHRFRKDSDLDKFRVRVFAREVPDDKILVPASLVKIISKETDLAYDEKLNFSSSKFSCDKIGKTTVKVLVPARFTINAFFQDFLYKFYIYTDLIECVAPVAEAENQVSLPEEDEGEEIAVVEFGARPQEEIDDVKKDEGPLQLIIDSLDKPVYPKQEINFNHTKPGEYSEVYVFVSNLKPGIAITADLSGPSVDTPVKQVLEADKNGTAHFTWKIFNYGKYVAHIQYHAPTEFLPVGPSINLTVNVN